MAQPPKKRKTPPRPAPRKNENKPVGTGQRPSGGDTPQLDSNSFILICERYAETGAAIRSCEELGWNHSTVLTAIGDMTRSGDTSWAENWRHAYNRFRESLEVEAIRRGREGVASKTRLDPKTGEVIVLERTYSDRLLELTLKGHFPERYRDKLHVSGTLGMGAVDEIDFLSQLTVEAKLKIREIIMTDLEEQRQARLAEEAQDAEYRELTPEELLADMRKGEEED